MPEKTRTVQDREFSEKCYFRWEFIRRNSNYRSDYQFFFNRFHNWFEDRGVSSGEIHGYDGLFWDDFLDNADPETESYFAVEIQTYVQAFLEKWGVSWPCDPKFSFERDRLNVNAQKEPTFSNYASTPVVDLHRHVRFEITLSSVNTMSQECDLSEVMEFARKIDKDSKEKPESYFEVLRRLGFHRSLRNNDWMRIHSELSPSKTGSQRLRLTDYEQYLTVWDFRESHPDSTWPDVANALYPEEYKQCERQTEPGSSNTVVQRVKYHHRRATELINGGFVKIR